MIYIASATSIITFVALVHGGTDANKCQIIIAISMQSYFSLLVQISELTIIPRLHIELTGLFNPSIN